MHSHIRDFFSTLRRISQSTNIPNYHPASLFAMASHLHASEGQPPNEHAPLLGIPLQGDDSVTSQHRVPAPIARRLYVSHFLSTWNSRVFEFGAVLYLATIYPGTLLVMSLYAFMRGLSAIIFAPAVGQYIDNGNRLQVVRVSIGKPSSLHVVPN